MGKTQVRHPLAIQTISCRTRCFCPVTRRTMRWNMGKSAVLEYEYSLKKLPPVPSLSSSPALSQCWQTGILLSNLHTFPRWCDSHSYYKHRATLAPNPPTSNGSYPVMLHKQGKASILLLATLFKIALPSKFQNLFSPSYNHMNHHLHWPRALFYFQNTSASFITSLGSYNIAHWPSLLLAP